MIDGVLSDAIEAFGYARQGTIGEATNIPLERWDFRPHPDAKNVSEVVRHIIDASLMLVGEAADPDGDYTRRSPDDHVADYAGHLPDTMTPSELVEALSSSLRPATSASVQWESTTGRPISSVSTDRHGCA